MKIGICIASYKNPDGLKKLLKSIDGLKSTNSLISLTIYVVVNAERLTSGYEELLVNYKGVQNQMNLIYQLEPKIGIPYVRNRLYRMSEGCDYIAFVDDDEFVHRLWLFNYVSNLSQRNAVLCGPVKARFKDGAPKWALDYGFYDSDEHAHLEPISVFYTNNVIINRKILMEVNGPFSEDMALTGGTDKLLALQLKGLGHEFIWVNNAIVYEDIPNNRVSIAWLFNRKKRIGYTNTLIDKIIGSFNLKTLLKKLFVDLLRLSIVGFLGIFSTKFRFKFIMSAGGFCGLLLFILGVRQEEYDPKKYRI